jgi:AraC-like DNA-binding protein
MALAFRIANDSAMIFSHRMERRILESLKVAAVEVPNDVTKADTAYQEIYDRIVAYFETEKPYLRSDLIIDDLVKVVFSNKLYISRAISQITGRNFCQFVNYYRIMYSVEAFRDNPELKATELANLSGFNSLVSFSMAFRLYMNENPSDWIRKERNRKAKSRLM